MKAQLSDEEIQKIIEGYCYRDSDGCLVWTGSIHKKDGTQIIKMPGNKQIRVRRFLHERLFGNLPKKIPRCSKNSKCVDPMHCHGATRSKTIAEKLSRFIITDTCCHVSPTQKNRRDYRKIWHNGKSLLAHREAYKLFIGLIPKGMEVHHICNNPACTNPAHLELVTPKRNKELAKRDRLLNVPRIKGEGHGNMRLKVVEIALIREMAANGIQTDDIKKKYRCSRGQIRGIVRNLKHKNIHVVEHIYGQSRYTDFRTAANLIAEHKADKAETLVVYDNGRTRYFYNDWIDERWLELDFNQINPWLWKILKAA